MIGLGQSPNLRIWCTRESLDIDSEQSSAERGKQMLTRRQVVQLLGQSIIAGPALAWANSLVESKDPNGSFQQSNPADTRSANPVYVVLWFDTEDYLLPASDDAVKRIAEFLSGQGVRATFKLVGEKARVLEARHRSDVIAALSRHEIGYHSDTHSQHPTIAEYESVLGWEQGAEEFDRRERAGFEDVGRIFGYAPTCFGQPGVSWAPQAYPTLKKWGVHVYLDDGPQVQLEGKPFWYGGLLNIFGIEAGRQLEPDDDWSNLESAKDYFKNLHAQLSQQPSGGLISFMFHPTQFVSQVFWDAVNFAHGANPARSEWKLQPERSPADREKAFQYFEGLIRHTRSFPNVQFVTASEAYTLYRDQAHVHNFEARELADIATHVNSQITFQVRDRYALAASEVFALLNSFVAMSAEQRSNVPLTLGYTPDGPASLGSGSVSTKPGQVEWSQFFRTSQDVRNFLEANQSIPNIVWLGSSPVIPESYLLALASVAQTMLRNEPVPSSVKILPAELAAARWVAQDSVSIWDWPIFPPGFHSPHLMDLARLQAWTLKPAILPLIRD
jgi:hypothetical protein